MFPYLHLILLYNLAPTEATKAKSVNLALETVLEFDDKNLKSDVQIIDNVQKFLHKVRSVLDKSTDFRRSNQKDILQFTEFVESAILIIKTYDDNDLGALINIVNEELRKYHYRGCKFYELVQNKKVRQVISDALDVIKAMPIRRVRRFLAKVLTKLQDKKFTNEELNVISYINSLYQTDATAKMYNFLKGLEYYKSKTKRSNSDLLKIVRNGVRSIVFDHYSNLHPNVRKDLKMKIATYFIEYSPKDNKIISTSVLRYTTVFDKDNDYNKEIIERDGKTIHPKKVKKQRKQHRKIKEIDKETEKPAFVDDDIEKYQKSRYISLFPEEITRKPKSRKNKIKKKSSREHDLHLVFDETKISKPRTWEKKTESQMIVTEDKPLREILTEHNAIIEVEGEITKAKPKHDHNGHKRSKNSKRYNISNPQRNFRSKAPHMSSLEKIGSIDERRKSLRYSDEGLKIASFENNDLRVAYDNKYRKKFDESKKRSMKRKEENLRRRLQKLRTKKGKMETDEPTTDSKYILAKINSLEEQIEHMNRRIDIVGFTADLRKSLPENMTKTKFPDIPFWTGSVTQDIPKTVQSFLKTTTTTEEPLYDTDGDMIYDTTLHITTVNGTAKTGTMPNLNATTKLISSGNSIKTTTAKSPTSILLLTPGFRSKDDSNVTDHKDLDNSAIAAIVKSKNIEDNTLGGKAVQIEKIEKVVIESLNDNNTRTDINQTVKGTKDKISEKMEEKNKGVELRYAFESNFNVTKENNTATTKGNKLVLATNSTERPTDKTTVLTTPIILNASLTLNNETDVPAIKRSGRRYIQFYSPPGNFSDDFYNNYT